VNIFISEDELREIEELVEEYRVFEGDGSYFYHLANYLIRLMVEKGVIKEH